MHQTWSFKRINGTAYPDSIASILRDASGGKRAPDAMLAYAQMGLLQPSNNWLAKKG